MRAIVFDLDGTLVDTTELVVNTYVTTIHLLGGAEVTINDILANFNIGPTPVLLKHFLGRPIAPQDLDVYFATYQAAISKLRPFQGVPDMLKRLKRKGYQLGLYTSATRRAVSLILPSTGLGEHFEAIVAGDEVTHPKPNPEGLEHICRRLGARATEAAYVGDAEVDLACARNAGVLGIQAVWGRVSPFAGDHLIAKQPNEIIALVGGCQQ